MLTDKQITEAYAGAFPNRSPVRAPEATVSHLGALPLAEQDQPAEPLTIPVPSALIEPPMAA